MADTPQRSFVIHNPMTVRYVKVIRTTAKAYLIAFEDGRDIWLPMSITILLPNSMVIEMPRKIAEDHGIDRFSPDSPYTKTLAFAKWKRTKGKKKGKSEAE